MCKKQSTEEIVRSITSNKLAIQIAMDVDNGKEFEEIVETYAKTPEMKQKIVTMKNKIEASLDEGKSLPEVLDLHITSDEKKKHILNKHKQAKAVIR